MSAMHSALTMLSLVGLKPVYVEGLRVAAAVVRECDVLLIRKGVPDEMIPQIVDQALAVAAAHLRESPRRP